MTDLVPSNPNEVLVTIPIPPAILRRKFTEPDLLFVIDYDNSKFKGKMMITYLSNLNINCKLQLNNHENTLELLSQYLRITTLVSIGDMEGLAMNMVLAYCGKPHRLPFDPAEFIAANDDILTVWKRRLFQLPLFAMHVLKKFEDYLEQFPEDDDDGMYGINYVHLIKHEDFAVLMEGYTDDMLTKNTTLFNEYLFAGKNLFHYFSVQSNPLFMGVLSLQDEASFNLMKPAIADAAKQLELVVPSIQLRIANVPSI